MNVPSFFGGLFSTETEPVIACGTLSGLGIPYRVSRSDTQETTLWVARLNAFYICNCYPPGYEEQKKLCKKLPQKN